MESDAELAESQRDEPDDHASVASAADGWSRRSIIAWWALALVVGALLLLWWANRSAEDPLAKLDTGVCLDGIAGLVEIDATDVVDCSVPHLYEVYMVGGATIGIPNPVPAASKAEDEIHRICYRSVGVELGEWLDDNSVGVRFLNRPNDTRVVCVAETASRSSSFIAELANG